VNHYYKRTRRGVIFVGPEGNRHRMETFAEFAKSGRIRDAFTGKEQLYLRVELYPPDRRVRDIDNPLKCLMDSLQKAGVYANDSQVRELHISFGLPEPGGRCIIEAREL
jgi:crossover junction endodeoxyribonuclease RusA